MKFGSIPLDEAEGAILAHSIRAGDLRLRKSHCLRREDLLGLRQAGMSDVIAAILDDSDVGEDEAARRIAAALRCRGVTAKPAATGRVNLHADADGVFVVDKALVDALNHVDPSITLATLAEFAAVTQGQMVATVKIIPFAVPLDVLQAGESSASGAEAFAVEPFSPHRVGLIQTVLPSLKPSVLEKTVLVTKARLARSGSRIISEQRVPHREDALAPAIQRAAEQSDMVIVFGASAMSDPEDTVPASIRAAGGEVLAVGMPVDPGNLLVLGRLGSTPLLGAPGCARSPKENGFDWVLDRLVAGLDVTSYDTAGMGVGGLLMEIPTRPQPRESGSEPAAPLSVHAVILAAGQSSRMGGANKLMALFEGRPLVRRTTEAALAATVSGVTVVTGHQRERIARALEGLDIDLTVNADYASGLGSSLKAGIARVPSTSDAVLVMLADMPAVNADDLDRLMEAFRASDGAAIVRATHDGKRGNPVILPRSLFVEIAAIKGDTGARQVIESGLAEVIDVELGRAASLDVDTPDALADAGGVLQD